MPCLVVCLCLAVTHSASAVATIGGNEACCFSTGFCLDLLPDDCVAVGGIPQGSGTDCASESCAPAESDCCIPHDTPGCDDEACEAVVCAQDPFCCNPLGSWDILCVNQAVDLCGDLCPPPTPPVNDDCADATAIFDGETVFDTTNASTDGQAHSELCQFDGQTYNDIWYDYFATCTDDLTVTTCEQLGGSADYDTDIVVYDGCGVCPPGDDLVLGCNDDDPSNPCGVIDYHSTVVVPVVSGNCYKIRIGGFKGGDSGTGIVSITCGSTPQCDVEGDPCDDGDACTEGSTCDADGNCVGGIPVDCPDDGNECTDTVCDPATGCGHVNNNADCDDGDVCTNGDVCSGGACSGEPFCDPGEVCVDGVCVPVGDCPEGNPCDDGDACTEGSTCDADDNCVGGTPIDCPKGKVCVDGECVHIWHVDDDANPANGCTSWLDACPDLQTALSLATPGDQIWVAQGRYIPSQQSDSKEPRTARFQLRYGVGMYGGFAGIEDSLEERAGLFDQTILTGDLDGNDVPVPCKEDLPNCDLYGGRCIDGMCIINQNNGGNSYHVVTGGGDELTILDGFTITAGNANEPPHGSGGGILLSGSSATVANCTMSGNSATSKGGGMYNVAGFNGALTDCTFSGNHALRGGGMYNEGSNINPTVTHCTFSANSASQGGGGMYNNASTPTVINCTFSANSAEGGGGMSNGPFSNLTVTHCTFIGNSASGNGGGMTNGTSSPTIANCTFSGNSAGLVGGGMRNNSTTNMTVTNCTFSGNVAGIGGGMFTTNMTVTNCIMWENIPDQISGSPAVSYSDVQGGWDGVGNIDTDPLFADAAGSDNIPGTLDDDLRLQPDSLAIDSGQNAAVPADTSDLDGDGDTDEPIPFDLDGEARFVDRLLTPDCPQAEKDPKVDCGIAPIVDMGAYEFGSDCNDNGIPDACDIDCDAKGGKCDPKTCGDSNDCNDNDIPDECEVPPIGPPENDCNGNEIPDDCELEGNDCDGNEVPDECDPDCNDNGTPDACDIDGGGSTDCDGDGVPDDCEIPPLGPPENDCNGNDVHDACDILNEDSDDCNGDGIPDECEIDENSPAPGGPFFCVENCDPDCDDNGIPDECDISGCPLGELVCNDCNLNGVPDGCDDPEDNIPDECIEFDGECAEGDTAWTCPENWEGDIVPDNSEVVTFSVTLAGLEDDVFLDDDITIDTLRVLADATLRVTQVGVGDFTVAAPGGILVEGNLLVANDRLINATAGAVTIGPDGIYQADPEAGGPVSATLEAGDVTVLSGSPSGGSLILSGSMGVVVHGDLHMQTADEDDDKGCDAPPDLNTIGNAEIDVQGDLIISGRACVNHDSSSPILLQGDFDNFSTDPDIFEWFDVEGPGDLQMNGGTQKIEAAGEDRGPWPYGLENNFAFKTLTLDAGTIVEVDDTFDNQQDGVIACDEALYVGTLNVGPGAVLLTDGCRVYYNELINEGAVPRLGVDVLQIRVPIPADLNGDGKVGPFDLALLLGAWGPCSAPCAPEGEPATCPPSCTPEDHAAICPSDIDDDHDCDVGPSDLALVLGFWGPVP